MSQPSSLSVQMLLFILFLAGFAHGQQLLFTQMLWRHGLRTPINTYANDPYDDAFFGAPGGEVLEQGMQQHFTRGQQLREMYVDEQKLMSGKYSRYETYVRSGDFPRCSQSAISNLAGFFADSPTYPTNVPNWPSAWTPVPIHTVPHDEDWILEAFDFCPKLDAKYYERMSRREFLDFVASNWRLLHIINANSGNPEDYTYGAIIGMYMSLSIEKDFNLTMPDWVTDEFYNQLEAATLAAQDYIYGEAGFGLPMDPEMTQLTAGFLLKDWLDNIDDVINGTSTLKYYAYSGHDKMVDSILIGMGVKQEIAGPANADYASTVICELWEKAGQYFVKLLFSMNIDSEFITFTSKLPGCGSDLCLLSDFKNFIQPLVAYDTKICDV